MKLKKISMILLALVMVWSASSITMPRVEAGEKVTVIDQTTYKEGTYWYCPGGDVLTDNNTLTFTKDSREYTKFISRFSVKADDYYPEFMTLDASIKFQSIGEGEKFVLAFGLQKLEPSMDDAGNVNVYFTNNNGIKVGVEAYESAGTATTVLEPKACGVSFNKTVRVRVSLSADKTLKCSINGKEVCSATIPLSGEGAIGFLQTGYCAATVTSLKITAYAYERPENTNVSEDFESGTLDLSKLYLSSTGDVGLFTLNKPARLTVEEYEGNGVLMFVGTMGYYMTTRYPYSNFEMTFDVPYMPDPKNLKEGETSATAYFESFALCFGIPTMADLDFWHTEAVDAIHFGKYHRVFSTKLKGFDTVMDKYHYYTDFKPFSVRLSVVDGEVNVGMKWVEEEKFQTIGSYTIPTGSPTGYIRFWVPDGGSVGIDNVKITNLDESPNLIETEFKSGKATVEDAAYEPFERVYAPTETVNEKTEAFPHYWLLAVVAVIGGGMLLVSALIVKRGKSKRRKDADEKKIHMS